MYLPGPAAAEGADKTIGVAEGPGNVVGINTILLFPEPVAMTTYKITPTFREKSY